MDPTKFNTSFIPKKPTIVTPGQNTSKTETKNIFSTISTVILVLTLLTLGGAFLYENILTNQIAQADQDLNTARASFETDKIQDLLDANARLLAVKDLLEKHVITSELLTLLQALTVKKIRFNSLAYLNKDGSPTIIMNGEAQTYNALAEQSRVFSSSEFIISPNFSGFGLSENGDVKMKFSAVLNPKLVSYKNAVESLSINQ